MIGEEVSCSQRGRRISEFFLNIFFILLLSEVFIMGSGQLLKIGSFFTLRMFFFILAIIFSLIIYLFKFSISKEIVLLLISYFTILSLASLIGLMNQAEIHLIFEDIKPLSYFLMILPLSIFIRNMDSVYKISSLIKFCSIILGVTYIVVLLLQSIHMINYLETLSYLDDFSIRENGFFYKGFLYICIGLVFFTISRGKLNKVISLVLAIAIILTFTRGFIVGLALTFLINFLFFSRKTKTTFLGLLALTFSLTMVLIFPNDLGMVRPDSDIIRLTQIYEVLDKATLFSLFFGHGFGIGVPIRPVHMEISYLEIIHKQGIIGLGFWFIFGTLIYTRWSELKLFKEIGRPFFLSSIFIYVETITNPFMNNPIGMSMLIISFLVLTLLVSLEEEKIIPHPLFQVESIKVETMDSS